MMSERVRIRTLLREFQEKSAASSRISLDIRRLFEVDLLQPEAKQAPIRLGSIF